MSDAERERDQALTERDVALEKVEAYRRALGVTWRGTPEWGFDYCNACEEPQEDRENIKLKDSRHKNGCPVGKVAKA